MNIINLYLDSFYKSITSLFKNIPLLFVLFFVFSSLYLNDIFTSNEEQYIQLSKQYIDTNWILHSQNLIEFPGTRLLYQNIIGHTLKIMSFEHTVFVFRLVFITMFSIILSHIYKRLSLSKLQTVFHLVVLYILLCKQSLFAGSLLFISVEPKTFAYILVFFAIYDIFNTRLYRSVCLLILATYFHVLVGAYTFIYIMVSLMIFHNPFGFTVRSKILSSLIYILSIIPFVIYLKTAVHISEGGSTISPNWIATYFRAPHHTALAPNLKYFYNNHLWGILCTFIGLLSTIQFYKLKWSKEIRFIHQFVIVSIAGTLLLVPFSFLDKEGVILKYYLYRINGLSTFLLCILITVWLYRIVKQEHLLMLKKCLLYTIIPVFFTLVIHTFYLKYKSTEYIDDICYYIKNNTPREALVFSFVEDLSITRKSERSRFVVYKFVPADFHKIFEWYNRVLEKRKVIDGNIMHLNTLKDTYNITHILCPIGTAQDHNWKLEYKNEKFCLYSI